MKKKAPELIPLEELVAAFRLIRKLRERDNEGRDIYRYMLIYTDEKYAERLLENEIVKHGYKKLDEKFYKVADLERLPAIQEKDYQKDDGTLYDKKALSVLPCIEI